MRKHEIDNCIAWLDTYASYMNEWQRDFVAGLQRYRSPTPRQVSKLEQVVRQVKIKLKYGELYANPAVAELLAQHAIEMDRHSPADVDDDD